MSWLQEIILHKCYWIFESDASEGVDSFTTIAAQTLELAVMQND